MSETFVDAAASLCAAALKHASHTAVMLHRDGGPIGLIIDNSELATDELRRWTLSEDHWHVNPLLAVLRRQLAIIGQEVIDPSEFNAMARRRGYSGADQLPLGIPLLGPRGWFGTVVYMDCAIATTEQERDLARLATELSVWCVTRGISTLPDARPLARRQHEVATLAASGRTNPEIAETLSISVNTVKLRLKQVYARLGVDNRAALGAMLRRLAALDGVPPGISHRNGYTITRPL